MTIFLLLGWASCLCTATSSRRRRRLRFSSPTSFCKKTFMRQVPQDNDADSSPPSPAIFLGYELKTWNRRVPLCCPCLCGSFFLSLFCFLVDLCELRGCCRFCTWNLLLRCSLCARRHLSQYDNSRIPMVLCNDSVGGPFGFDF